MGYLQKPELTSQKCKLHLLLISFVLCYAFFLSILFHLTLTKSLQARFCHPYSIGGETEGLRQALKQLTVQDWWVCLTPNQCFFVYTTQTRAPAMPIWGPGTQAKDLFLFWLLVSTGSCVKVENCYSPCITQKTSTPTPSGKLVNV